MSENRFWVWWNNFKNFPSRMMANYLKKHGWVVFYLDEQSRHCSGPGQVCWLEIYNAEERRRKEK